MCSVSVVITNVYTAALLDQYCGRDGRCDAVYNSKVPELELGDQREYSVLSLTQYWQYLQ